MMLHMDPPNHTRYRALVSREFIPRSATALRPRIEELAKKIIDDVIERGECDLMPEIAGVLPSYVIAELMGIPLADGRRMYALTEKMHSAHEAVNEQERAAALMEMLQLRARSRGGETQASAATTSRPSCSIPRSMATT